MTRQEVLSMCGFKSEEEFLDACRSEDDDSTPYEQSGGNYDDAWAIGFDRGMASVCKRWLDYFKV